MQNFSICSYHVNYIRVISQWVTIRTTVLRFFVTPIPLFGRGCIQLDFPLRIQGLSYCISDLCFWFLAIKTHRKALCLLPRSLFFLLCLSFSILRISASLWFLHVRFWTEFINQGFLMFRLLPHSFHLAPFISVLFLIHSFLLWFLKDIPPISFPQLID